MGSTTGPFLAVCLLVMAAGLAKLWSPAAAGRTVAALKLPGVRALSTDSAIRFLGLGEILVAAAALWWGGRAGAAVITVVFLAFAAVIGRALQVGSDVDCGCFGRASSPLTRTHLVVDLAFAGTAAVGLLLAPTGLRDFAVAPVLEQVATGAAALLLAATAYQLFTALPAVNRARTLATGGQRAQVEVG